MTRAIQSRIARIRVSVGRFDSPADTSSARLSSSRQVHLISTRGRTRSGATRSSRGKSSTFRSPLALSLMIRCPNFRSDTAHRNSARASDRKSVLLLSCSSSLSKRTERSSAGARSAWNLAFRRGLVAGASIRFFLVFRAIVHPFEYPIILLFPSYIGVEWDKPSSLLTKRWTADAVRANFETNVFGTPSVLQAPLPVLALLATTEFKNSLRRGSP